MPKLHLNTDLFFFLRDKEIVLWDFQNHQQFALTLPYFERLVAHSRGEISENIENLSPIDQDLLDGGVLLREAPQEPNWKWDKLSYIFHVGTRNVGYDFPTTTNEWLEDYMAHCEQSVENMPSEMFVKREGTFTPLLAPNLQELDRISFSQILKERQTVRNFEGQPVSIEVLSTLLFVTFGLFHGPWQELSDAGLREVGIRKTSASGGGLHPNEAYVTINHVPGIEPGTYHYDVERHGLVRVNDGVSDDQLMSLCMGQPFGRGIAFGVFLVGYLNKIWWKYPHSRGYRVLLLDAGHLSQTFQLVATSLGILTWLTANIHDVNVSTQLKLEGVHQAPLHFLGAGYGQKSGVFSGIAEYLQS